MTTTATTIRSPAVAGMFYPANPQELHQMVHQFLQAVTTGIDQTTKVALVPKAIIAPHAGYIYSGPVAASVYAYLIAARQVIKRVVLLGPSHRVPLHGLAATGMSSFATPLGQVPVEQAAIQQLLQLPQVTLLEQAHEREHSLEVQLPFLQTVLEEFTLIPLVVGEATPAEVAEVLELFLGEAETLIVISSDLSHYHDYHTAQIIDKMTSTAIENLRPQDIHAEQACGRYPINGLLSVAKTHRMKVQTIDLRNSGDTAGPRHQVVGYGAYVFH